MAHFLGGECCRQPTKEDDRSLRLQISLAERWHRLADIWRLNKKWAVMRQTVQGQVNIGACLLQDDCCLDVKWPHTSKI